MVLQDSKTEILPVDDFINKYIQPERRTEVLEIDDKIIGILGKYGYDVYDLETFGVSPEIFDEIKSLDLQSFLLGQIRSDEPNYKLIRYILNMLPDLKDQDIIVMLDSINKLYPVFTEILTFMQRKKFETPIKKKIGNKLLEIYNDPINNSIKYRKMWIANCFVCDPELIDSTQLIKIYESGDDDIKREITIALGKKGEVGWVRSMKRDWNKLSPWLKRSYLSAAGCLPDDERTYFFKSIKDRLDPIEVQIFQ